MNVEERLLDYIDRATEPRLMPKEAALDILENIVDALLSRIEALREEIKEP